MSTPVHCNVCGRDFATTEKFVEHFESRYDHWEHSGTYEAEYVEGTA